MGISHLSGSEYLESDPREAIMAETLRKLENNTWELNLRTNEYTVLFNGKMNIQKVCRKETRIEEGHLTLNETSFIITGTPNWRINLPVNQFKEVKDYGDGLMLVFDNFQWVFSS